MTCEGEESNTFQQDLVDCCDPQEFIVVIFKQSPTLGESVLVTVIATTLKVWHHRNSFAKYMPFGKCLWPLPSIRMGSTEAILRIMI